MARMGGFVDVSAFKPKRAPQRFSSFFQGIRGCLRSGTAAEREPLKGDGEVVKKSPAEIYAESEKEAMAFVLCVAVASLGLYMCTGLIVYGYGPMEHWGAIRAIYFSIATLTTVGLNPSLTPTSQASRLFTTFFGLFGILIDGFALSELWAYIADRHNKQVDQWNQAFARALSGRMESSRMLQPLVEHARESPWCNFWSMVLRAIWPLLVVNALGAGTIGLIEGWSMIDVIYYATFTCTTMGYGGLHPTKASSYVVAILYFPLTALAVARALSVMAQYFLRKAEEERREWLLNHAYSWEGLFEVDTNRDGHIGESEFIVYFLRLWGMADPAVVRAITRRFRAVLWGMADPAVVQAITRRFRELDRDGSGHLTRDDFLNDDNLRAAASPAATIEKEAV